jgi:hypothetical protein
MDSALASWIMALLQQGRALLQKDLTFNYHGIWHVSLYRSLVQSPLVYSLPSALTFNAGAAPSHTLKASFTFAAGAVRDKKILALLAAKVETDEEVEAAAVGSSSAIKSKKTSGKGKGQSVKGGGKKRVGGKG